MMAQPARCTSAQPQPPSAAFDEADKIEIGWRLLAGADARLAALAALFLGRAERADCLAALLAGLPLHRDGPAALFAEIDRLGAELDAIREAMAEHAATTLAGFAAKAQVILDQQCPDVPGQLTAGSASSDLTSSLCRDILAAVERLPEMEPGNACRPA